MAANPWADLRAAVRLRLRSQIPALASSCASWTGEDDEILARLARSCGAAAWLRVRAVRAIPGAPEAQDDAEAELEILAVATSQSDRATAAEQADALAWAVRSALRGHVPVAWANADGLAFLSQTVRFSTPSACAIELLLRVSLHLADWPAT